MRGLGRRQRNMLLNMTQFGDGQWPKHWRQRSDDREVLESLHRKGLVTSTAVYAALTNEGERVVAAIMLRE